jgi:hypothetical protein
MTDTDRRDRGNDHCTEEDCVDFVRGQAAPQVRSRLEGHLDGGCSRCTETVRLWRTVLGVAFQEASYLPPEEAVRQARGNFALARPQGRAERLRQHVALLFDSFRQPLAAGVRAAGLGPRQLLYKAGRYTIRLRLEPAADAERMSIVGQILDEQDPPAALQDIAVLALRENRTLDRTLTNHLGEFLLEPDAAENLQLCVGVAEIGTFTVQPPRGTDGTVRSTPFRALDGSGRRKRARQR